jgi:hypothetical protein
MFLVCCMLYNDGVVCVWEHGGSPTSRSCFNDTSLVASGVIIRTNGALGGRAHCAPSGQCKCCCITGRSLLLLSHRFSAAALGSWKAAFLALTSNWPAVTMSQGLRRAMWPLGIGEVPVRWVQQCRTPMGAARAGQLSSGPFLLNPGPQG